jgi:hypothetical protein
MLKAPKTAKSEHMKEKIQNNRPILDLGEISDKDKTRYELCNP